MNMLLSMIMINSLILMSLKHPLSLGLILILQTLMMATITGYILKSFFFSYIIIIIMLSGTLVLFIYMASIASNEKFKLSFYLMVFSFIMFLLIMHMFMNYNTIYFSEQMYCSEPISLMKMFNMSIAQLTMVTILYLLLTMIVVSNIAKVSEGPLRMKK
uniref:NADH dehydrogenase subunit 6 n=1 Tax=Dalpada cinctipes TaxID=1310295 RepID=UPI001D108C8C|nr:NADH dehydrogenase subunit 6 [Dalpada cinctipes]UCC45971.1 NADH dehydrogenase subunit 6 [Dalpada cinctipes]